MYFWVVLGLRLIVFPVLWETVLRLTEILLLLPLCEVLPGR